MWEIAGAILVFVSSTGLAALSVYRQTELRKLKLSIHRRSVETRLWPRRSFAYRDYVYGCPSHIGRNEEVLWKKEGF